jgi:hypothetical protein
MVPTLDRGCDSSPRARIGAGRAGERRLMGADLPPQGSFSTSAMTDPSASRRTAAGLS